MKAHYPKHTGSHYRSNYSIQIITKEGYTS